MIRNLFIGIFIFALLLLSVSMALAQELTLEPTSEVISPDDDVIVIMPDEPEPMPDEPDILIPGDLPEPIENQFAFILKGLATLLVDGTSVPALAAGVLVIVNLLKAILARLKIEANPVIVALFVQVAAWLAYVVTTRFGFADVFQMYWGNFIPILQAFIPLVGATALAHKWYEGARSAGNPILGYKPEPPLSSVEARGYGYPIR